MFQAEVVEKIIAYILRSKISFFFPPENRAVYEAMSKNTV